MVPKPRINPAVLGPPGSDSPVGSPMCVVSLPGGIIVGGRVGEWAKGRQQRDIGGRREVREVVFLHFTQAVRESRIHFMKAMKSNGAANLQSASEPLIPLSR